MGEPSMPARSCSKWSGRCAGAGASSWRSAARSASSLAGLIAIFAIAYSARGAQLLARRDLLVPHRHRRCVLSPPALVLRAPAAAPGHRRAGGALSRRARADARARSSPRWPSPAIGDRVAGAGAPPGRERDRAPPPGRRRRAHRTRAAETVQSGVGAVVARWPSPSSPSARPILRHTLSALLCISRDVEAAAPYRIEVTPGDATVPKGADQTISATLSGFDAADATILIRKAPRAPTSACRWCKAENGSYDGMLFDLAESLEYYVEAAGVPLAPRSRSRCVELPYVKKLDLEYRFPSYTGLEPRKVEDGGDIAVLSGTDVRLTITPTMAVEGRTRRDRRQGQRAADRECRRHARRPASRPTHDGFYRVELDAPAARRSTASPQYTIDILRIRRRSVTLVQAGPRHRRHAGPGVLRRGARRRRLRGEEPAAGVLGQRRAGEDDPAVRRRASRRAK